MILKKSFKKEPYLCRDHFYLEHDLKKLLLIVLPELSQDQLADILEDVLRGNGRDEKNYYIEEDDPLLLNLVDHVKKFL